MFRRPARVFAPLSLVACAIAVLVIVNGNHKGGGSTRPQTTRTSSTTATGRPAHRRRAKTYVVKDGDVLSAIAIRTGVPLQTLQALNPNVDAQSLHAGQKLKLAP